MARHPIDAAFECGHQPLPRHAAERVDALHGQAYATL
jgi:hypothetical protein